MECIQPQTRSRFIFSSKKVLQNGVRTHANSKGKIFSTGGSEEDRTGDADRAGQQGGGRVQEGGGGEHLLGTLW